MPPKAAQADDLPKSADAPRINRAKRTA
jgi:hypothetical protein